MAKGDLLLREVPIEIVRIINKEQAKVKAERDIKQFSLSSTIYKIVKEWNNKCRES